MRMLVMLFALTSFVACNSNSVPEKSEPGKTVVVKSISLNDSTINLVSSLFDQYESLKNGLVDYNIPAVDSSATFLSSILNKFSISDIQDAALTDSIHYSIKNMEASVNAILAKGSIEDKKRSFSQLSESFYLFLTRIQFDQFTLYKQTCPMAFNDNESASWISRSTEIYNPYLGKKHPKYAAGMLNCGEVSDSVSFKK
jgi:hypothetical protein